MIVSEYDSPPIDGCAGCVHSFERGLDPWHADAFPDEFKYAGTCGERRSGWFVLDAWGNAIGFIVDGTEIKE